MSRAQCVFAGSKNILHTQGAEPEIRHAKVVVVQKRIYLSVYLSLSIYIYNYMSR